MKHRPGRLITIGSFDGVHRGHAALLERAVLEGKKRRLKSLALTFSVPPRMILSQGHTISILSDPLEKEFLIKSKGLSEVVTLDFNKDFSRIKPYAFFRDILLNRYKAKGIVVGLDFRFGADRSGGAVDLVRWGEEERIPVWVISQIKFQRKVVSSTEIREELLSHPFNKALRFLGHPYLIQGKIIRGRGVGKKLGYPTANLEPSPGKVLPQGVFIVRGLELGDRSKRIYTGVCNIGRRPTFLKKSRVVIEPHWFEPDPPRPGQRMIIELLHCLRPEKKFQSIELLKKAIGKNIQQAKRYFAMHGKNDSIYKCK